MKKIQMFLAGFLSVLAAMSVSASEVGPLASAEAGLAFGGATHYVKITHLDLTETSTNTAQTLTLFNVADKMGVKVVCAKLTTPFVDDDDATNNSNALTVGDGGDADRFLTSMELNENGTEIDLQYGTGTELVYTTSDTVDLVIGSNTNGSLAELDAGELTVYLQVIDGR